MAISYCWIEWLQSSCLDAIGVTSTLLLSRLSADGYDDPTCSHQHPQHDSHVDDPDTHCSLLSDRSPVDHHSDSETSSATCVSAPDASGTWWPQHSEQGCPSRHLRHQEQQYHDSSGRQQETQAAAQDIDPQHSSEALMIRLVQYDAARGFALFQQVHSSYSSSSSFSSLTFSSCSGAASIWVLFFFDSESFANRTRRIVCALRRAACFMSRIKRAALDAHHYPTNRGQVAAIRGWCCSIVTKQWWRWCTPVCVCVCMCVSDCVGQPLVPGVLR